MYQDSSSEEEAFRLKSKKKILKKHSSKKGPSPHDCPVCFVTFSSIWTANRHLRRYQTPKYQCTRCHITFTDGALLRFHIQHQHEPAILKKSTLQCPICSQIISSRAPRKSLQSHLYHYHKGWEALNLFASDPDSCPDGGGALSAVADREDGETIGMKKSRDQHLMKLMKHLTTKFRNENPNKIDAVDESSSDDSSSDESSSDEARKAAYNEIRRMQLRRSSRNSSGRAFRDAELRFIYSCRDCYVPLPRISGTTKASSVERTEEKDKHSNQNEYTGKNNQFELINIQVAPERFSNPFIKSEVFNDESYNSQGLSTEALEECYDPLSFPPKFEEPYGDVDEPLGEGTRIIDNSAQYKVPLCFPMFKTEVESLETDENSGVPLSTFAQGDVKESFMIPTKDEPMDCDIDEHPTLGTEFPPNFPELASIAPGKSDVSSGTPDVSRDVPAVLNAAKSTEYEAKLVINSGLHYSNNISKAEPQPPQISRCGDQPFLPESVKIIRRAQQTWTRIASKLCNKVFSNRRMMLRHFRERHLTSSILATYCTCGKEMIGRRAMEKHFSRHCDELIETERPDSNFRSECQPLEKKYSCRKCGEKFWLESCRDDHPPHCENTKGIKKPPAPPLFQLPTINEERRGYVCRVCDVRFSCVEALSRHVRALITNEIHRCETCKSVFPGTRLLKGHVQATHRPACITYKCFCSICNQGFSKNIYRHIHMKHIHTRDVTPSVANSIDNFDHSVPATVISNVNIPENQCTVCNLLFVNRKRFNDHVSYYNKNEVFRCNICGEAFLGQFKAHHHRKEVHYGGSVQNAYAHYCAICNEGFMYKTHLHAHMFHVHDREFNCVQSVNHSAGDTSDQKSLANSAGNKSKAKSLANPAGDASETKSLLNPFNNNRLPNQIATVSLSDSPLPTDKGDVQSCESIPTRVKCSRCNDQFSTWSGWSYHVKNVHTSDSTNPLGFHFVTTETPPTTNSSDMDNTAPSDETTVEKKPTDWNNDHMLGGEINDGDYQASTLCNICGFDCPGPGGLARHEAMYINRGIYACEYCGRKFNWKSFYRDHKLKHSRRDVYNKCFCPICDEGFENTDFLRMHTIHLHKQSLDILPKRTSQASSLPTGSVSNDLDNYHSVHRKDNRYQNRFYISSDQNTHPKIANIIDRERSQRNHTTELTKNFYRYTNFEDLSLKCDLCNIFFATSELLAIHDEIVHKQSAKVELASKNVNREDSSHTNVSDKSPNTIQAPSSAATSENRAPQTVAVTSRKVILRLPQSNGKIRATDLNPFDFSQCKSCKIVFGDKKLLASHDELVHRVKIPNSKSSNDERCSELSNSAGVSGDQATKPELVKTALATKPLPNQPNQSDSRAEEPPLEPVSKPKSPEVIQISDDESEENIRVSGTVKNPPIKINKIISRTLPNGMRLIKLPPGNYKIAKLKVRSVDTIVGKLMKYPKPTKRDEKL